MGDFKVDFLDAYGYNKCMNLLKGVGEFFALDIGTNSVRAIQLIGDIQHGWTLQKFAYIPIESGLAENQSELGRRKFQDTVKKALMQAGIKTKNVAVGLPATKTFTTVIDVANGPEKEVRSIVKYELDKYIPMAIEEAKADFTLLGISPNDPAKVEVLISSTANKFAEEKLKDIEDLGLNVIAFEPESLAMTRALAPVGSSDAHLIVDMGEKSADIVMIYKGAPRLVRSIPGGFEGMAKTTATALSINEDQARQFILKFGLAQDKVDGQVFRALDATLDGFTTELTKSVKFFQSKYLNIKVGGIVLSGYTDMIPFISEYIEAKTNIVTSHGNPWQLVRVTPEQQQALQSVASEFSVAIGLAERSNL